MKKWDKLFIICEAAIWLSFLVMDFFDLPTTLFKYSGIILCFLYSLLKKNILISLAQFFTLLADFFLLVIDRYYAVGLVSFLLVQIIYMTYLCKNGVKSFVLLRIVLPIFGISILCFIKMNSVVNVLSVIYFSQLLVNCFSSYTNKKLRLFSLGLSLFILCDICVGLHNVCRYSFVIAWLQWFFYLPSQTLIVLSSSD